MDVASAKLVHSAVAGGTLSLSRVGSSVVELQPMTMSGDRLLKYSHDEKLVVSRTSKRARDC